MEGNRTPSLVVIIRQDSPIPGVIIITMMIIKDINNSYQRVTCVLWRVTIEQWRWHS